jgi:GT2 family glycosyltransferase/glycosyltransferase involved in cell wall biosynthesis
MNQKDNSSALRQGNIALRENKYSLALEKYMEALKELPELAAVIEFNISLARRHIADSNQSSHDTARTNAQKEPTVKKAAPASKKTGHNALRGYFDRLDETGIYGWATDEARPDESIELSIFIDGVHFMDINTTDNRKDLIANKIPGAKAGFQLAWPAKLFNSGSTFDIKFKGSPKSLSKSPKKFHCDNPIVTRHNISYLDEFKSGTIASTTVVVPIYNAYEAVSECIASLIEHTTGKVKFLLIDDCSTDPRISALFSNYKNDRRFELVRNRKNLGYTCTVNKAIKLCLNNDVVLLNSDTVVTNRWLENLRYAAYSRSRVATVTALSDNAGAFSAPEIGIFNPVPQSLDISTYAKTITTGADGRLLEVPTGNGFCMFIRRAALSKIGLFDEIKFPRGYGEENDFCMRALRLGWHNLVCDKVYIFHKRSQSFQGEKIQLMAAGSTQLGVDYPDYKHLTKRFRDVEFTYVRHRARASLEGNKNATASRVLYVISTQTGGTPQTNLDLMRSMEGRHKCFLLRCDSKTITLSELENSELIVKETYTLSRPIEPTTHTSDEYDRVVLDMMYRHSIDLLHIRHIAWHSMGLAAAAKSINLPVIYSSHDFYAVCPSLNLLDQDLKYCGGKCTKGAGTCQIALWEPQQLPPLKDHFIHRWRETFSEFFNNCDVIISTAPSAKKIFLDAFPKCSEKFVVIPHGRDFDSFEAPASSENMNKIKVLVPGNISRSKGAHLIKQIAELDKDNRLEFNFLGNVAGILDKVGIHHGNYQRSEFRGKVKKISPTVGVVLSIWPETYCHTLTEMWASGIPVFGINVGAVGDRIHQSKAGWLIPPDSTAQQIYDFILSEAQNPEGYEQRLSAVKRWQSTEGRWNNTSTMSAEYRLIYQRLLAKTSRPPLRIGLLVKGNKTHPATAYIRLLQPLSKVNLNLVGVDARPIDAQWLMAGGVKALDAVIIQRDAIPSKHTDGVISILKKGDIPYIYEIDDLLWDLPPSNTDHAIDAAQQKAIKKLMINATLVTTSTEALRGEIAQFNDSVTVIPNYHDKALWLSPIPQDLRQQVLSDSGLTHTKPRILYMGTKSHAEDLKLVFNALREISKTHPDVEILQIGGGLVLPGAVELNVPEHISSYIDFVTWFRVISSAASIAIAPLEDNRFNKAKSDIKMLDYSFAGLPAIYSSVGAYASSVENERTGLLVENSTESWVAAIETLLGDKGLQETIRSESLTASLRRSDICKITNPWLNTISAVLAPSNKAADKANVPHAHVDI